METKKKVKFGNIVSGLTPTNEVKYYKDAYLWHRNTDRIEKVWCYIIPEKGFNRYFFHLRVVDPKTTVGLHHAINICLDRTTKVLYGNRVLFLNKEELKEEFNKHVVKLSDRLSNALKAQKKL